MAWLATHGITEAHTVGFTVGVAWAIFWNAVTPLVLNLIWPRKR